MAYVYTTGSSYGLAKTTRGTVWGWGYNANSQFGDGTTVSRSSPVSVVGNHSFVKVTIGSISNLGLKADGTCWAWGYFAYGAGNSNITTYLSPTQINNFVFTDIAAGEYVFAGLDANGTVWTWGYNNTLYTCCGDGTQINRSSPVSVIGNHSFSKIYGTFYRMIGLKADGSVWNWGYDYLGNMGNNYAAGYSAQYADKMGGGLSFVQICCGGAQQLNSCSGLGLMADGSAWGWGNNTKGVLGNNSIVSNATSPVSVVGNHSFIFLVSGSGVSAGLKSNGEIWTWGNNVVGSLGTNSSVASLSSPISVVGEHSFVELSGGLLQFAGRKSDGSLWMWGYNTDGELGDNTSLATSHKSSPVSVIGGHSFITISIGEFASYALKADGSAWSWGLNSFGELGDLSITQKSSPVSVVGGHSFVKISGGGQVVLARKTDGSIWAWGKGTSGALGDNTILSKSSPVSVLGSHSCVDILSGMDWNLILKEDGSLWTWGLNTENELGNDTYGAVTNNKSSPVSVITRYGAVFNKLPTSGADSKTGHAIETSTGKVWNWGYAANSGLCRPPNWSPVQVIGNHSFVSLAPAVHWTYGLKSDGSAWVWGWQNAYQLGDGTLTSKSSPVSVVGNHSFVTISTGSTATVGRKADGTVWCWGATGIGNSGIGFWDNLSSPVVIANSRSFVYAAVASSACMALDSTGQLWTWGENNTGQGALGFQSKVLLRPVRLAKDHLFTKIFAQSQSYWIYANDAEGYTWVWGTNVYGVLGTGNGHFMVSQTPTRIAGNHQFVYCRQNGTQRAQATFLKADGSAWGVGYNAGGQAGCLGDNSIIIRSSPVSMVGSHSFTHVFPIDTSTILFKQSDGTVWGCGWNGEGEIGDGTIAYRSSPTVVLGNHSFVNIFTVSQGAADMCITGLKSDGTVWGWGNNTYGQIGNGTALAAGHRSSPVSVLGDHSFVQVNGTDYNTCYGIGHRFGLKSDGTLWTWGCNIYGQLGDGTTTYRSSPVSVVGNHSFIKIYTAAYGGSTSSQTFALKEDGSAWAWGYGPYWSLGQGISNISRSSPVSVIGNHSFTKLFIGGNLPRYGLKSNGELWGWNYYIGHPSGLTNISSPVLIMSNVSDVAVTLDATFAIKNDGTSWVWGSTANISADGFDDWATPQKALKAYYRGW